MAQRLQQRDAVQLSVARALHQRRVAFLPLLLADVVGRDAFQYCVYTVGAKRPDLLFRCSCRHFMLAPVAAVLSLDLRQLQLQCLCVVAPVAAALSLVDCNTCNKHKPSVTGIARAAFRNR